MSSSACGDVRSKFSRQQAWRFACRKNPQHKRQWTRLKFKLHMTRRDENSYTVTHSVVEDQPEKSLNDPRSENLLQVLRLKVSASQVAYLASVPSTFSPINHFKPLNPLTPAPKNCVKTFLPSEINHMLKYRCRVAKSWNTSVEGKKKRGERSRRHHKGAIDGKISAVNRKFPRFFFRKIVLLRRRRAHRAQHKSQNRFPQIFSTTGTVWARSGIWCIAVEGGGYPLARSDLSARVRKRLNIKVT